MPPIGVDAAGPSGPGPQLNAPPPRPPRDTRGVLQIGRETGGVGGGIPMGDPSVRLMSKLGSARQVLLDLAADLPQLGPGIQQFIDALTQTAISSMADLVSGQPPSPPGMMSPTPPASGIGQAPTAAPTATSP